MTATAPIAIEILNEPFDPEGTLARFRHALDDAGAMASFVGLVRADDGVDALTLEHYPGFTEQEIDRFARAATTRWPVQRVLIIHRVGALAPGEPIVAVAAASQHRRDAFQCVDYLMDYLKSEAPFWKRETVAGKHRWIEPRRQDYEDKDRWRPADARRA